MAHSLKQGIGKVWMSQALILGLGFRGLGFSGVEGLGFRVLGV